MSERKWFFGWTNWKWFIREIVKIYSGEQSYFSKKRIESGIAFAIFQFGMMKYLFYYMPRTRDGLGISMTDFALWAGLELMICGYTLQQIQKEKTEIRNNEKDEPKA